MLAEAGTVKFKVGDEVLIKVMSIDHGIGVILEQCSNNLGTNWYVRVNTTSEIKEFHQSWLRKLSKLEKVLK